jgi:hypothetical protein
MTKVKDLLKPKNKKNLPVPGTEMTKNGRSVHMMHISPNWMKDNATGGRK